MSPRSRTNQNRPNKRTPEPSPSEENLFTRGSAGSEKIRAALELLCERGGVYELRIPMGIMPKKVGTISGYFNDLDALAEEAASLTEGGANAVYMTLNPASNELLARAANRTLSWAKSTTTDDQIPRLLRLFIDLDPARPSGISSTDSEHNAALKKARGIRTGLRKLGFPDPLLIDSGNGAYLVYAIDLPNDDESRSLIQSVLRNLDQRYSDEFVHVDTKVGNPARIIRVPGTWNRKGDSVGARPHRLARIVDKPKKLIAIKKSALVAISSSSQPDHNAPTTAGGANGQWDRARMQAFLTASGIKVAREKPHNEGILFELQRCPMMPAGEPHAEDRAAYVGLKPGKPPTAGCHHDRCRWNWRSLLDRYDPNRSFRTSGTGSTPPSSTQDDLPEALKRARTVHLCRTREEAEVLRTRRSTATIFERSDEALLDTLRGKVIKLWTSPDRNDIAWAIHARARLRGVCRKLIILSPPNGGTVHEFLESKVPLASAVEVDLDREEDKLYEGYLNDADALRDGVPPPIIEQMLYRGNVTNLIAPPKSGKTYLCCQLALSIASGDRFLGCSTSRAIVVYVSWELSQAVLRERMKQIDARAEELITSGQIRFHAVTERGLPRSIDLASPDGMTKLSLMARRARNSNHDTTVVFVVDTLEKTAPFLKAKDDKEWSQLYAGLADFAAREDVSIVAVDHVHRSRRELEASSAAHGNQFKGRSAAYNIKLDAVRDSRKEVIGWRLESEGWYSDGLNLPLIKRIVGVGFELADWSDLEELEKKTKPPTKEQQAAEWLSYAAQSEVRRDELQQRFSPEIGARYLNAAISQFCSNRRDAAGAHWVQWQGPEMRARSTPKTKPRRRKVAKRDDDAEGAELL